MPTYQVIWKHFVVTPHERKPFRSCWIAYGLAINSYAQVFITVQNRIEIWKIVPLRVLQSNPWFKVSDCLGCLLRQKPYQWGQ